FYTHTEGYPGASLTLQGSDSNLVVYASSGKALWSWITGLLVPEGGPGDQGQTGQSLAALNFGATVSSTPVVANHHLFFAATDSVNQKQLWVSDGTSSGTVRLTSGNVRNFGLNPSGLTAVGNLVYFFANDGMNGQQLWRSDGTVGGTTSVTSGSPGGD